MIKYFSVVFSRVSSGGGLSIKNKFPLLLHPWVCTTSAIGKFVMRLKYRTEIEDNHVQCPTLSQTL